MARLCHLASVSGFHMAFQRSREAQATSILKQTKPIQNKKKEKKCQNRVTTFVVYFKCQYLRSKQFQPTHTHPHTFSSI